MKIPFVIKKFIPNVFLMMIVISFSVSCSLFNKANDIKDIEAKYVLGPDEGEEILKPSKYKPYLSRIYFIHFGNTRLEFMFLSKGFLKSFKYREDNRIPRVVYDEIFIKTPEDYWNGRACFALEAKQQSPSDENGFKRWRLEIVDINNQTYELDYEHIYYGHSRLSMSGSGNRYERYPGGVFCTKNVSKQLSEDFQKVLSRGFELRFFEDKQDDPEDFITLSYKNKSFEVKKITPEKVEEEKPEIIEKTPEELNEEQKKKKRKNWRRFQSS